MVSMPGERGHCFVTGRESTITYFGLWTTLKGPGPLLGSYDCQMKHKYTIIYCLIRTISECCRIHVADVVYGFPGGLMCIVLMAWLFD